MNMDSANDALAYNVMCTTMDDVKILSDDARWKNDLYSSPRVICIEVLWFHWTSIRNGVE
jgi:hypothetical protein